MLRLASDGIVGFSDRPLTLCGEFGAALLFLTFLGLAALIVLACCKVAFPAWLWAVCGLVALNGITLLFMSLQGMYMNRIYDEAKARPLYIVAEELNMDE
jgi:dolichol-phosphate mannosyltransferase